MPSDTLTVDIPLGSLQPEVHLSRAIAHIEAAQQTCPATLRDDALLTTAATEVGAARAYIDASREAQDAE